MIELIFVVFWMSINLVVVLNLFDFSSYSYIIYIASIAGITALSTTISLIMLALISNFISYFLNSIKRKKISEFLKTIPDNCYIDKIDGKFYIKPLNFLSSHQKLDMQKKYTDEFKDIPKFIMRDISLFDNYGTSICYIKYNKKLSISEFVLENGEKIFSTRHL